jgi:hypothetical protein
MNGSSADLECLCGFEDARASRQMRLDAVDDIGGYCRTPE